MIRPRLKGKWWRLEAITPDGLPDTMGLWNLKTWWCELKVGRPGRDALRASQREFAYDCIGQGLPIYTCFGYKGEVLFFMNLNFDDLIVPPFLRQEN